MYRLEEGNADLKRKELARGIIMLVSTVVLSLFIWATTSRYGMSAPYVGVYILWFAISIYCTKAYLFLTPRKRFGTVKAIKDFKGAFIRKNSGASGAGTNYSGAEVVVCTLTVAFDNGKESDLDFVYRGDLKILKPGDRIGIFRFLKMPVWETNPN